MKQGHVVAQARREPASRSLPAGESGLTLLAYGTRRSTDICYYPRSRKISFRGLGVIGQIEPLDYWEGEE